MPGYACELIGTFCEKCQNIDFTVKTFLRKTFYLLNNFQLIFMMLQINKTKHYLNFAENVLFYAISKKKDISSNFYQLF